MSNNPVESTAPRPQLGLFDAISIIVGIVIGTTVYMMPTLIFVNTKNPTWGLVVWGLGGLIALIGAFCYAELATTYPKAGGDYYYLTKGFGPKTGFLFGWAQLMVVMPASIGVMAYVFADFLQQVVVPPDESLYFELPIGERTLLFEPHFAIAAQVVLAITLLNLLGVVLGKTIQNLLSVAKVVGLGAIIFAGFRWGAENAWVSSKPADANIASFGSLAMILVLYAYGGWNDAAFVAAEVRDPKRNIPRALLIGVVTITAVYLLVNAAYINALGWDDVTQFGPKAVPVRVIEKTPLADVGGKAMAILVMVSALGAVNGLIFTGARVYATLGAEHRLFGWMGYWRPGKGAPIMALLLQAILTVFIVAAITTKQGQETINEGLDHLNKGLAQVSEYIQEMDPDREIPSIEFDRAWNPESGFDKLVARTAPVFWFFFLLTGLALFRLREKNPGTPRPFSVPFYPLVPIIFCCACVWMLYQAIIYVEWHCLFAMVLVLLGLPFYWVSRLLFGPPGERGPLGPGLMRTMPDPQPQKPKIIR